MTVPPCIETLSHSNGILQLGIDLPYEQEFELYHNALSLCSMKTRACLAELRIPYASHPIDLIETGCYENIGRDFLAVNPGGTVVIVSAANENNSHGYCQNTQKRQ